MSAEEGWSVRQGGDEPVSPTGQYFNSSVMSVFVLSAFESEVPIDDSPTMDVLRNLLLPVNSRFSSIMVEHKKGEKKWRRVAVNLEDHVNVPVFPSGLSVEDYHRCTQEYLTKIGMEKMRQDRPLWEIHIIKFPTLTGEGTLVFKLHHALGDGFTLYSALFSCLKRADDPSLPFTFPSSLEGNERNPNLWQRAAHSLRVGINTAREFGWTLIKGEDDRSPVRSGDPGVEFRPVVISSLIFPLDELRKIKIKVGGTINDVITGIIFLGLQLYVQKENDRRVAFNSTALVLLNTRVVKSYQSLEEIMKPDGKSPWGNQFGFLHVSLPKSYDPERVKPLDFVLQAKKTIGRKKNSLAVFLNGMLLETIRKLKGPEVAAKYVHGTLRDTTLTISNMVGPLEKLEIAGQKCKSYYFMVVGVPQSLTITMLSYMGKLRVAFGTEKDFIDEQRLVSCMEKAFDMMSAEARGGHSKMK
ncbi:wax ester synthase/diacylglycerol acyltransferase 4-like isoform X2 [Wolffia australiana]